MKRLIRAILLIGIFLILSACKKEAAPTDTAEATPTDIVKATPTDTEAVPTDTVKASADILNIPSSDASKAPAPEPADNPKPTSKDPNSLPILVNPALTDEVRVQAEELADDLIQEKGWDKYSYVDKVREAVIVILTNTTITSPEFLKERLSDNIDIIEINDVIEHGYYDSATKTIKLNTKIGKACTLVHEMTHSICGNTVENFEPNPLDLDWCFVSRESAYVDEFESNYRLSEGLTDFLGFRYLEDATVSYGSNTLDGIDFYASYYSVDGPMYPMEQGLSIPFYYAVGSEAVEEAYYGAPRITENFISRFGELYGKDKLEYFIHAIDENIIYMGNPHLLSKEQQREGLDKIKNYITELLDVLKVRLDHIKTEKELEAYILDINCFEKFTLKISDNDFMDRVRDRIGQMTSKANEQLNYIVTNPKAADKYSAYENLIDEFKKNGYLVEAKNVEPDYLEGERKWVTLEDKENLAIYIFDDIAQMEKNAGFIDLGGCTITTDAGSKTHISWVSYPHFYKQGNIIVLYVGENMEIIQLLEEMFGEEFAGFKAVTDKGIE